MRYVAKPQVVEAIRYGHTETGEWYPGAAVDVACFIAGIDFTDFTDPVIDDYVREWAVNPPNWPTILIEAGENGCQGWVPVPVGHWIVRKAGDRSDHWPVADEHFRQKYARLVDGEA